MIEGCWELNYFVVEEREQLGVVLGQLEVVGWPVASTLEWLKTIPEAYPFSFLLIYKWRTSLYTVQRFARLWGWV
jgi:hypothetical protein